MGGRMVTAIGACLVGSMMVLGAAGCGSGASSANAAPSASATPTVAASATAGSSVRYASVSEPAEPSKAKADRSDAGDLSAPLWSFGLDLLTRQAAKTDGNVVVSPLSLSAVLSMTLNGARGETAAQMREALRLDSLEQANVNQAWADLIAATNETERAQVRVADSLWLRDGVTYVPSFLATNRDYFAADALSLPDDLAKAPDEINAWVAERTGGRIKDLIGTLPEETALVLVNTVYVKVGWEVFDKAQTTSEAFTLGSGEQVEVSMMHGSTAADVAITDGYDAVPVETNGELILWVVVPKGSQTPESVAASLESGGAHSLAKTTTYATVDLEIPRFKVEYESQDLTADLAAMGMTDAFSPDAADFSGMANLQPLYIGEVLQKAVIDVNEKGIEAAAGSAVVMDGSGQPTKRLTVRADRPFLVVITGESTEAPLFMALVRDPR